MKAKRNKDTLDYETWKKLADQIIDKELGMGIDDCPDICSTYQWWYEGMSYTAAAKKFVKAQKKDAGF
jgi:hypothetical protein